jgi:hypothetical protein
MAPRLRSAVVRFDALPEPVLRILFLALPVDERARAACVCRSWRAFLADPSLWQVLDLTPAGVAAVRVTQNLVRSAGARAAGQLLELSFDSEALPVDVEEVLRLIESDGAQLQKLNTNWISFNELEAVRAAAPRLQAFNTQVMGECTELLPVLRNDPPYGPLRLSAVEVSFSGEVAAADLLALAAAIRAHEPLKRLSVSKADFARGPNALLKIAAERRLSWVTLGERCVLDAESIPALARLLQRGSLTQLEVNCDGFPHAQDASVPVLCAALRSCPTLVCLKLALRPPNDADRRTVTDLLDAAAALPALASLNLRWSAFQDGAAAGHAFGALLGANPPSLRTLDVSCCRLGDEGVAALLPGLAANTHLHNLHCGYNSMSEAFKRGQLRPALAALAARTQLNDA